MLSSAADVTDLARTRGLDQEVCAWTEDQDVFGIGIATWSTNTVERDLES